MTAPAALGTAARATLCELADALIPGGEGQPSASAAGVHDRLIDRVLAVRPQAAPSFVALLERLAADPDSGLGTPTERAQRLRERQPGLLDRYGPEARHVLEHLLEKYAEHGDAQFVLPDVLHVPPISGHGTVPEIVQLFGGPDQLRTAVTELQAELYAA